MPRLLVLVLGLASAACISPVRSSALRTAPESAPAPAPAPAAAAPVAPEAVTVLLTRDPAQGTEIGVVEAHGRRPVATLEALVGELRQRAFGLGGDGVRVDGIGSRFEMITEAYTYDCGTTTTEMQTRTVVSSDGKGHMTSTFQTVPVTRHLPRTCTGTRQVEAETMTITGRAFRGSSPEAK